MADKPPVIQPVAGTSTTKKAPAKQKKGSGQKGKGTTYIDPYQLGVTGKNTYLGQTPIQGSNVFFGIKPTAPGPFSRSALGHQLGPRTTLPELTADEAILRFQHLSGQALANVQLQLYRAGFYGKTPPIYGQYRQEDGQAFRQMIVGLATNPTQGTLTDYLSQSADAGDKQGVNQSSATRAPLVIKHVDDQTLTATFQNAATQLLGAHLPDDQLARMIGAYHAMESNNATAAYNLKDPNATGVIESGPGGDVAETPSPSDYAATQIQSLNPGQYAANSFGEKVMGALNSLRSTGYLPSGGGSGGV